MSNINHRTIIDDPVGSAKAERLVLRGYAAARTLLSHRSLRARLLATTSELTGLER